MARKRSSHLRTLTLLVALAMLLVRPSVSAAQPDDETEDPDLGDDDDDDADDAEDAEDGDAEDPPPEPEPESESDTETEPESESGGESASESEGEPESASDGAKPEGAADEVDKPPSEDRWSWLRIGAYFKPNFRILYRPNALPKDELDFGFRGSAGVVIDARPFDMWRARLDVVFSDEVLRAVTDVAEEGAVVRKQSVPGSILQDAWVGFQPVNEFGIVAGAMRIPFSLQAQSSNTELVFPNRSEPFRIFQSGSDFGALINTNIADGIFTSSAGVFNGDSLGLGIPGTEERGVVFAFRADVNPFGKFAFGEGDYQRGPFRLGVGGGVLARPITLFDQATGTEPRDAVELRFAASLRMAVRGLYLGAEYFRRQQTNDFSNRPDVADGAYAQLGFFFPVADVIGFEPIARAGFVAFDQTFDPRLVGYLEAGFNVFPVLDAERPDMVRIGLQYFGERRFTEEEEAHGGVVSIQLAF